MKIFCILSILSVLCLSFTSALPGPTCYPTEVVGGNTGTIFIGYGESAYQYQLPGLKLLQSKTYTDALLCYPGTFEPNGEEGILVWGSNATNDGSVYISASDLSIIDRDDETPAPANGDAPTWFQCTPTIDGVKYCYEHNTTDGVSTQQIVKEVNNEVVDSVIIPDDDFLKTYLSLDPISGNLALATATAQIRSQSNFTFWTISTNPLQILSQGYVLTTTASYGCPVQPSQCDVPSVLLDFMATDDIAVWLWSSIKSGSFVAYITTYDARCNKETTVQIGQDSGDASPRCAANNGGSDGSNADDASGNDANADGGDDDEDEGDDGNNSGSCSSQACCDAIANPNYQTGSGFFQYNPSCLQGGIHCIGNSGCQLCFRGTSDQMNEGNRPQCNF